MIARVYRTSCKISARKAI